MIDFEKMTEAARKILIRAQEDARERRHSELEPLHILFTIVDERENIGAKLLGMLAIDPQELSDRLLVELNRHPTLQDVPEQVPMSRESARLLQKAANIAERYFKDEYLSIEHILLAIVRYDKSAAGKILAEFGTTEDKLLVALQKVRGSQRVTDDKPESKYDVLKQYGIDFTEMARRGKLDPVIGRQEEIRRVMKVLSRRTKNNPALIGEPGVGKTAIVEGLAQKIIAGDVPESLKETSLIQLDMSALLAGTQYRGEFEKRLKSFIDEVKSSQGKIILFIDEMHTIIDAGAVGGSMDASNMLKPALARGELRMIGATTIEEYRKYVEKDPALERRFAPITVEEPSVDETISILRGLKERYEVHHGVRIQDDALVAAAKLSARYISGRFLPDKAIDLIDEAAANLRIDLYSQPEQIDSLEKEIAQLKIEKKGLADDPDRAKKTAVIDEKLRTLQGEYDRLKAHWLTEKEIISDIRELKEKIEETRFQLEEAQRKNDLNLAARLKFGALPEIQKELEQKHKRLEDVQKDLRLLKEEVDADDIARVISEWTGIPLERLTESETQKLLRLEDTLRTRVVGQDHAVEAVANVVRIARSGLSDPKRPLGSFIFLGSTGVGKTELAKALAEALFDTEDALIRIDMSEYMEKFSVSRLIGAPPGYVGYDEGGQLTEAVRRHPFSVVLFDEIEKAHSEVFNVLLQVLDDGRLTDNKGRTVSFTNTILIMTSNLGSRYIMEITERLTAENRDELRGELERKLLDLLRHTLPPEFINRIDETLVFNPLLKEDVERIVRIQFELIRKRMQENDVDVEISDAAVSELAQQGFDPAFGARPVKRVLQQEVVQLLAREVLSGKVSAGSSVTVDIHNGEFVVV